MRHRPSFILLAALAVLAVGAPTSGQTHSLIGVLVDVDGNPIKLGGAAVVGGTTRRGADTLGVFRLDSLSLGPVMLELSGFGLRRDTVVVEVEADMVPQRFTLVEDTSFYLNYPPDPIPFEVEGGILTDFESNGREVRLLLTSEYVFNYLNYGFRFDTYERPGVLGIVVYGVLRLGHLAPTSTGPARSVISLGTPSDFESLDVHLTRKDVTDTIRLVRSGWFMRIEDVAGDRTVVRDSLELVLPGSAWLQCTSAGHPTAVCAEFTDSLVSETGGWHRVLREDIYRRVFGRTSVASNPPEGVFLVGRGINEWELEGLRRRAQELTARYGGRAGVSVGVTTWAGFRLICREGECSEGRVIW